MALSNSLTTPPSDSTANFGPADGGPASCRVGLEVAGLTDPGRVRTSNEDHFLIAKLAKSMQVCQTSLPEGHGTHFADEVGHLFVVADGMGGAAAGERASALAVESVEEFALNTLKWFFHFSGQEQHTLFAELRDGLERADREIVEQARQDYRLRGMGTTLTMAYSLGTDLFLVHAGDSRAYLYHDGTLQQLTRDHTLVQLLINGGALRPEDAKTHKNRNIVTNVLGGPREGVEAEIHKLALADGDLLLLCSDGLTEPLTDDEIAAILGRARDPEEACAQLIAWANERGGPDNITAVVARYRIS